MVTYFESTFTSTNGIAVNTTFPLQEPCVYAPKKGTWHWVNCTGINGNMYLVQDPIDSSKLCLKMIHDYAGTRPLAANQQVKLYNLQNRESDNWVEPYLTSKEAYYTGYYYFPSNFKTKEWRLILQICGEYGVYGNTISSPQMGLIFGDVALEYQASGKYYADGKDRVFSLINTADLPKNRWVQIVVYVKQGSAFKTEDGVVKIWINDTLVLNKTNLATSTVSGTPLVIWGIGNYGGPNEEFGQFILVKNVSVSSIYPVISDGGESVATVTFNGSAKDENVNTPLNGVTVAITVTKPDGSTETITATTNTQGTFTTQKTYTTTGNYSAQATFTLTDYNPKTSDKKTWTITKVNGDMTVTFNASVA